MQSKWDIILQWIQSVPLGLSLCVRKNEPVRMCSVCRKSKQYVSLYFRVNRVLFCVCVCVCALDVAKSRIAVSSAAVAQHWLLGVCVRVCVCVCVCVCVWEYISSGCWSVSAKCHEGRESGHTTLLYIILSHTHTHTHLMQATNTAGSKSLGMKIKFEPGYKQFSNKQIFFFFFF